MAVHLVLGSNLAPFNFKLVSCNVWFGTRGAVLMASYGAKALAVTQKSPSQSFGFSNKNSTDLNWLLLTVCIVLIDDVR